MGYKVLTVAIFLCVLKPAHVRAQCSQPNFEGNVVLSDDDISKNDFPDGSKVTFVCMTGYVPVGRRSESVTCNGNKWTELALSCARKSCGSLPEVINGKYEIPNGILFGDSVTGVCNKGYLSSIYGPTQRTCRADGWDGRHLECEAVQCKPPQVIENGRYDDQEDPDRPYEYGVGVYYKCDPGFSLIGSDVIKCSDDGKFQPEPPKCIVVSCPTPNVPNAIRIGGKAPPYGLNNFIQFKCNDGYDMIGQDHITCKANGWSTESPQCIAVKCLSPQVIENGRYDEKEDPDKPYEYGDVVYYKCDPGFNLIGSDVIKCSDDGKFHPEPPKCIVISCRRPNVPNGKRIGGKAPPYSLNNFIQFRCNDGYDMIGQDRITCKANGWSPEPPQCIGYCEPPVFEGNVIISKASEVPQKYHEGTSVIFECKSGYKQVDSKASNKTKCVSKRWTSLKLKCRAVKCLSPQVIENGWYDEKEDPDKPYEYGDWMYYKCDPGFNLIASDVIKCSDDGKFHPEPPKCIVISCPAVNVPNGKQIDGKAPPYVLNNFIQFKCHDGYDMIGQDRITCKANGWSPEPPQCIGYCKPPVFEGHVTISKASEVPQNYHEGTSVTFECKSGYKQVDSKASNIMTCKDKEWTPLELTCKE